MDREGTVTSVFALYFNALQWPAALGADMAAVLGALLDDLAYALRLSRRSIRILRTEGLLTSFVSVTRNASLPIADRDLLLTMLRYPYPYLNAIYRNLTNSTETVTLSSVVLTQSSDSPGWECGATCITIITAVCTSVCCCCCCCCLFLAAVWRNRRKHRQTKHDPFDDHDGSAYGVRRSTHHVNPPTMHGRLRPSETVIPFGDNDRNPLNRVVIVLDEPFHVAPSRSLNSTEAAFDDPFHVKVPLPAVEPGVLASRPFGSNGMGRPKLSPSTEPFDFPANATEDELIESSFMIDVLEPEDLMFETDLVQTVGSEPEPVGYFAV